MGLRKIKSSKFQICMSKFKIQYLLEEFKSYCSDVKSGRGVYNIPVLAMASSSNSWNRSLSYKTNYNIKKTSQNTKYWAFK